MRHCSFGPGSESRICIETDAGITEGISLRDLQGPVRAAVLQENILEFSIRLGQDALDALREVIRRVVERGYNADQGLELSDDVLDR